MARSGALIPLLLGGAVAAGVVYAMTRESKAKTTGDEPRLPGETFEPLPPGALPDEVLAKYEQALTFPTAPDELVALVGELEALGAHYEAAQVRLILGGLQGGQALPPGAMPEELQAAYMAALHMPETYSHGDMLDLADDLDMAGANYEAEQIRDLAAALHGVEPPAPGGGPPLAGEPVEPIALDPANIEHQTPPFVPPGTMPGTPGTTPPSIWDQLHDNLGQMIPPGLTPPASLPQPPEGQAPPSMPGELPGDFQPPPPPAPGGSPGSYTVKAGDTLWRIAERGLGDLQRWGELVALNLGEYEPHAEWGLMLHPGDVIKVPSDFNL